MEYTIRSRKLKKDITFSVPGEAYIFVDLNGKPGTLGNQICSGGSLCGSTLRYEGENIDRFKSICKKWWRAYLSKDR